MSACKSNRNREERTNTWYTVDILLNTNYLHLRDLSENQRLKLGDMISVVTMDTGQARFSKRNIKVKKKVKYD